MEAKDYLRYYWLETYLETEVRSAFHTNHYLTAEQFFAIIIWKRNASKTLIKRSLLNAKSVSELDSVVKSVTKKIYDASTKEGKLAVLLNERGFQLSMASAVLTILYPDTFSVYDFRVCEVLGFKNISADEYFEKYIPAVKNISPNLSLRDCDRALWAKSWHQDLQTFLFS